MSKWDSGSRGGRRRRHASLGIAVALAGGAARWFAPGAAAVDSIGSIVLAVALALLVADAFGLFRGAGRSRS